MKKFVGSVLLSVLLLSSLVKADCPCNIASVTMTSSVSPANANVALMFSKSGLLAALTYTTSAFPYATAVGPAVTIKKLWIESMAPNFGPTGTTPVNLTVTVWDAPNGNTQSASARKVRDYFVNLTSAYPRWTDDFVVVTGSNKDSDGAYFKYNPTIVDGQANSAAVYILWDQKPKNLVIPGYTQ